MKACFDIDGVVFPAASIMQDTYITVTHPKLPEREFDNRTSLWGHHKKREGGWVAAQVDLDGKPLYHPDEFTVVDGVRLRDFKIKAKFDDEEDTFVPAIVGAKRLIDMKIKEIVDKLGADEYYGYTGEGLVFRHDLCQLMPYKGQRTGPSPLLLKELKAYVVEKHNIKLVTELEADDWCSIESVRAYKEWKKHGKDDDYKVVIVQWDKDGKQTEGWFYNPDKMDEPELIEGLGKLWLTPKGDVDGRGRMWLYYQVASGDSADHYCANCFSDTKWGAKSAYKELVNCTTDKQAFEAMVKIFKKLYPETKTVEGCKGEVEIDWLFVMQECFNMAFMLRHSNTPRDSVDVKATLDKLGVDY